MICEVANCGANRTTKRAHYCEKHYYRIRRNGTPELKPKAAKLSYLTSHGYVRERLFDHPVSDSDGVFQHRRVYYDLHGSGPFQCHHCSTPVTWDTMHVDHLDANKKNNAPENLVASCPMCNWARGHAKSKRTQRDRGIQITALGRTRNIHDWSDDLGINPGAILGRLKHGWSADRAVSEPRDYSRGGPKRTLK